MSPDPGMDGAPVTSTRIVDTLAERILSGRLPPGTRIKQDELAEELRASRIPVREALRILAARGLVTLRANTGAWVAQMSLRDLDLSYQIRERIEPLLLTESMPRLTGDDLEAMRAIQDEIETNTDVERFLALDRRFHWQAYRCHQAPHLADIIARLWDTTQHYRRAFARLALQERSWIIAAEHRLLIESIAAGDQHGAAEVLCMHIRRTRSELERHPELFPDTPA